MATFIKKLFPSVKADDELIDPQEVLRVSHQINAI